MDDLPLSALAEALGYTSPSSVHGIHSEKWNKFITRKPGKRPRITEENLALAVEYKKNEQEYLDNFWQFIHYLHEELNMSESTIVVFLIDKAGMLNYKNLRSFERAVFLNKMPLKKIKLVLAVAEHDELYKKYQEFYTY